MSFGNFETVDDVLEKYPLLLKKEMFLPQVELSLPIWFAETIEFVVSMQVASDDESYCRENFIAPYLQQIWKRHPKLKVWFQKKLRYDDVLFGEPDYFVSQRPTGIVHKLVNLPLLAVMEAKKDDFTKGWGQCLAEMVACQKLNEADGRPNLVVYGIVSTGLMWEFGKLEGQVFIQEPFPYSLKESSLVLGVLDYLFNACEKQLED